MKAIQTMKYTYECFGLHSCNTDSQRHLSEHSYIQFIQISLLICIKIYHNLYNAYMSKISEVI